MKRLLAKSLVLVLVLALFAVLAVGCSNNEEDEVEATPAPTEAPAQEDNQDEDPGDETDAPVVTDGWERPANHITVDMFGRAGIGGIGEQDGWFGQMIYDRFNMTINQISAPDGNNQLLWDTRAMAGNLGDIVLFSAPDLDELRAMGLLMDITDLVNESTMPFYTSQFGPGLERARAVGDGRLFGLSTSVSTQPAGAAYVDGHHISRSPFMRQDLYFAIGAPVINTLEDLPGVLAQMRDYAPYTANGDRVYAFQLWGTWCGGDVFLTNANWFQQMYGMQQFGRAGNIDFINRRHDHIFDENGIYRRALRMFFEANQLGLVDPDSPTQGDEIWSKAEEGNLLFSWYSWFGMGFNNEENVANAMGMNFIPIMDQRVFVNEINQDGRGRDLMGVGSDAADPERIIAFFDWLATPEVFQNIHAGPQGLTWDMVNGEPVMLPFGFEAGMHTQAGAEDLPVPAEWGGGDFNLGSWRNASLILRHRGWEMNPNTGFTYDPRHWPSLAQAGTNPLELAWQEHFGASGQAEFLRQNNMIAPAPSHGVDFEDRPELSGDLLLIFNSVIDVARPAAWRMIFADSAEDFDSIWEEMIDTINGLGWQQILDHDLALVDEFFGLLDEYFANN